MKKLLILLLCLPIILAAQNEEEKKDSGSYAPGDHELLLMPTAYTLGEGQSYFTDYELFLLNYTYGITGTTHIGIFTLFPVTSDFLETLTFGAKQQLFQNDFTATAVWATYTPKGGGLTYGAVLSLGQQSKLNGHFAIAGLSNGGTELMFLAGAKFQFTKSLSGILEYTNLETGFENDFGGIFSLGVRFVSGSIAWEIGGFRPLGEDTGGLILFPLLKATVVF